jgi:3-methyladenine DNA glycosylase AlkD
MTKPQQSVRTQLISFAEDSYRQFMEGLLPGVSDILGVRLPVLQKLARKLLQAEGRYEAPLAAYHEEILLEGLTIGAARLPIAARLEKTAAFVPKITNWAVCDSFCASLKITAEEKETTWAFLFPYFESKEEFFVRFAVVMLLCYYTDAADLPRALEALQTVSHPGYYAKMAVAWAVSVLFAHHPKETKAFLQTCRLDAETLAKALQKIRDSRRVSLEDKAWLAGLGKR